MRNNKMSSNTPIQQLVLTEVLTKWMLEKHAAHNGTKKVTSKERNDFHERATHVLREARKNKSLRILEVKGVITAIAFRIKTKMPRVKNQQGLSVFYDNKNLKKIKPWLKETIAEISKSSPRFTQVYLNPKEDLALGSCLPKAGFDTRYEILLGETNTALKNLMNKKKPFADLKHLDLEIKEVKTAAKLSDVMKLQKKVSNASRSHTYFAHTPAQLKKDKIEYAQIISEKSGMILGVYRNKALLGAMIVGIHGEGTHKSGGISLFLHSSIQGKGVSKTGYRLMLEFLKKNKVATFMGGTSQPAVLALGKVMKRKAQFVIYVKMK
jgi:hypothetical protein